MDQTSLDDLNLGYFGSLDDTTLVLVCSNMMFINGGRMFDVCRTQGMCFKLAWLILIAAPQFKHSPLSVFPFVIFGLRNAAQTFQSKVSQTNTLGSWFVVFPCGYHPCNIEPGSMIRELRIRCMSISIRSTTWVKLEITV